MRFSFIDAKRAEFPVARLCEVLEVSQSGYFAWKNRPASERQCKDMVLLAHIRERFRLSQETYGSPRMHADLVEDGIIAGRHRIARLMRDNNLKARQKRRFKKTTDGQPIPVMSGLPKAGFILPLSSTYSRAALSDGRSVTG
jgi:putative transposase